MSLVETIQSYQGKINDFNILAEYHFFFANVGDEEKFVLDRDKEFDQLNNIILRIEKLDNHAEIYVNVNRSYGTNNDCSIYADTLWIDTIIELEEIEKLFHRNTAIDIEPSDIVLLKDNEKIDGTIDFVILADGQVESFISFIGRKNFETMKSIYWD